MIEGTTTTVKNDNSQKTITTIIYALQAVSFLMGITFVVAVVINYVKESDVAGTWLESHFRWQIRTFWFSLLWSIAGLISTLFVIANAVWVIYRVVKGWLYLNEGKEMYPE